MLGMYRWLSVTHPLQNLREGLGWEIKERKQSWDAGEYTRTDQRVLKIWINYAKYTDLEITKIVYLVTCVRNANTERRSSTQSCGWIMSSPNFGPVSLNFDPLLSIFCMTLSRNIDAASHSRKDGELKLHKPPSLAPASTEAENVKHLKSIKIKLRKVCVLRKKTWND